MKKSMKKTTAPKSVIVKSNPDVVVMKNAPKPKTAKKKSGGDK